MEHSSIHDVLRRFVDDRNWDQFHTPANLAASISIEAGELLECFQWDRSDTGSAIEELADVLIYCYLLAGKLGIDPEEIMMAKINLNEQKYPIDKSWGRSDKYDKF